MKQILEYIKKWRNTDFVLKTILGSKASLIINMGFVILNGYMGIIYDSSWNKAICIYYILLGGIRGYIVFNRKKEQSNEDIIYLRKSIYIKTHVVLCIMNVAMLAPIGLMIHGEKNMYMA